MNEAVGTTQNFIGYEYKNIAAKRDEASIYLDCYPSFGWEIENSVFNNHINRTALTLKRNRKLRNKMEINKLQRQFEEGVGRIQHLEATKGSRASIVAYTVGIIGTAFMAGSVFAFLAGLIALSIILAVPGFICWALPLFLYRKILSKRAAEIIPEIDKEFDLIYSTCEKAHLLSGGQAS